MRGREKMGELKKQSSLLSRHTPPRMPTVSDQLAPALPKQEQRNAYPWYCPLFWHGMGVGDFLKLASKNHFRIRPGRWGMTVSATCYGIFNSTFGGIQRLFFRRKIEETAIEQPPIFILGHWRSGTTYLHELLSLDERFCTPNYYQCLAPMHFLVTEAVISRVCWWMVPRQRPMDNMEAGFKHPQEDEFALCNLGVPTPYLRMAFPNEPAPYLEYLNMEGVPQEDRKRWKDTLVNFAKSITYAYDKPIVFKSPPHTGRIEILLEAFPDARFVHIARHPYELFASTMRLWKTLDEIQGFQFPNNVGREEYVFDCFERMYRGYERQRRLIPAGRLYEIRYEELTADPLEEMRKVYEKLDLGEFENVQPRLEEYLKDHQDYQRNQHVLAAEIREQIDRRWGDYMERFCYPGSAGQA